jgi:hypothetical protein
MLAWTQTQDPCLEYHMWFYLKLQLVQSISLRVTGDYPSGNPIPHLHDILNLLKPSGNFTYDQV